MTEATPASTPHILVVNKAKKDGELMERFLQGEGYEVSPVNSLSEFDTALENPNRYGLAFVDADGFPSDLWDRCERLQMEGIPFLLLSLNPKSVVAETESGGGQSIEQKPVEKETLLGFIESITD